MKKLLIILILLFTAIIIKSENITIVNKYYRYSKLTEQLLERNNVNYFFSIDTDTKMLYIYDINKDQIIESFKIVNGKKDGNDYIFKVVQLSTHIVFYYSVLFDKDGYPDKIIIENDYEFIVFQISDFLANSL